jgi:hypothetical protein
MAGLQPPDSACAGPLLNPNADSDGILDPGHYSTISKSAVLRPGIYCIEGTPSAIKMTSGSLVGNGVVLYIREGDVEITGNGSHNLTAPRATANCGSTPQSCCNDTLGTCDWVGLLMWVDEDNTAGQQDVSFGGGAASFYRGTIYAPVHDCFIAGNNYTQALETQFICNTATVIGTGDVMIQYQPGDIFHVPPALTVAE